MPIVFPAWWLLVAAGIILAAGLLARYKARR